MCARGAAAGRLHESVLSISSCAKAVRVRVDSAINGVMRGLKALRGFYIAADAAKARPEAGKQLKANLKVSYVARALAVIYRAHLAHMRCAVAQELYKKNKPEADWVALKGPMERVIDPPYASCAAAGASKFPARAAGAARRHAYRAYPVSPYSTPPASTAYPPSPYAAQRAPAAPLTPTPAPQPAYAHPFGAFPYAIPPQPAYGAFAAQPAPVAPGGPPPGAVPPIPPDAAQARPRHPQTATELYPGMEFQVGHYGKPCTYCTHVGHNGDRCWKKWPGLRPPAGGS